MTAPAPGAPSPDYDHTAAQGWAARIPDPAQARVRPAPGVEQNTRDGYTSDPATWPTLGAVRLKGPDLVGRAVRIKAHDFVSCYLPPIDDVCGQCGWVKSRPWHHVPAGTEPHLSAPPQPDRPAPRLPHRDQLTETMQAWVATGALVPTPADWNTLVGQRDRANRRAIAAASEHDAVLALCDHADRHGGSLWPHEVRRVLGSIAAPQSTSRGGSAPAAPGTTSDVAPPTGPGTAHPAPVAGGANPPGINTAGFRHAFATAEDVTDSPGLTVDAITDLCDELDSVREALRLTTSALVAKVAADDTGWAWLADRIRTHRDPARTDPVVIRTNSGNGCDGPSES